ncbi:hypothetical protein G7Y85_11855 [Solimonas terrae]|uniref:Tetratricopeptide repeat protein n=1 Tax=Solimonas terrae TaxID=1396819 RepID=A0A6M2BS84_9GAMM|nr:hypothetical protein [Solimonas terrae]
MAGAALLLGTTASFAEDALRPQVGEPLQNAQTALKSKNYREALADVDAAEKVGGLTPYESYIIDRMRAAAATGAGDEATAIKAYEAAMASPKFPAGEKLQTYDVMAKLAYAGKNYTKSAELIRKYRAAGGTSAQTLGLLPQTLYLANDLGGAQEELNAQLATLEKAGQKPTETQLEMLASIAVKKKDNAGYIAALEKLVAYYPKPNYWLDLITRTANKPGFSPRLTLDTYRLKKATDTMLKTEDFMEAAQLALQAGFPGEAQQYVNLGYDKKLLGTGPDAARHKRLKDLVDKKVAEDKPALAAGDKEAATQASGDALVNAGLNHVGYGDAANGVKLIEQGIKKDALKKPDEAKLHLGYAQMMAGQKDAAAKTLRTVQTPDGSIELARLYILMLRQH